LACLDLGRIERDPERQSEFLDAFVLATRLVDPVIVLEGFGHLSDSHDGHHYVAALEKILERWPYDSLVMLRAEESESWRAVVGSRRVVELRTDRQGYSEQDEWWRRAGLAAGVVLNEGELPLLAGQLRLTPGQLRQVVATARDLATMDGMGRPGAIHLARATRLGSDQGLGRLATKVESKHQWADLILPELTLRRLRDLTAAIRHRALVFEQWGFGTRVTAAAGIRALFAGVSGTGKTMAAGVVARSLELDLYRIDLSGVVSKYIGETEKNLDRIFAAARRANAIVFLDEAEALLGKRSEVKDAHDRYANIEVAYLLQKLEEHDGIVILATNLKHNIDDAFNRRMQYVIDFPRPEPMERERIWRRMFPERAPVDPQVAFRFLAKQFDLAGGDICNVALDAAFLAAQEGGSIGMAVIVEALSRLLVKQGKTPTASDFRQYQPMRVLGVTRGSS
jgi:hypothetical protein